MRIPGVDPAWGRDTRSIAICYLGAGRVFRAESTRRRRLKSGRGHLDHGPPSVQVRTPRITAETRWRGVRSRFEPATRSVPSSFLLPFDCRRAHAHASGSPLRSIDPHCKVVNQIGPGHGHRTSSRHRMIPGGKRDAQHREGAKRSADFERADLSALDLADPVRPRPTTEDRGQDVRSENDSTARNVYHATNQRDPSIGAPSCIGG